MGEGRHPSQPEPVLNQPWEQTCFFFSSLWLLSTAGTFALSLSLLGIMPGKTPASVKGKGEIRYLPEKEKRRSKRTS